MTGCPHRQERYPTRAAAHTAITTRELRSRLAGNGRHRALTPRECRDCSAWHIIRAPHPNPAAA